MINTAKPYQDMLYLDIETVRGAKSFGELPMDMQLAWKNLCASRWPDNPKIDELYVEQAPLFPEFGKIVCISIGLFTKKGEDVVFRVKAITGTEAEIFFQLNAVMSRSIKKICGHNILQFDVPYIIRRAVANKADLPTTFNTYGKKPWDLDELIIDTRLIWAAGAWNLGSCSLESICACLGVKSPKSGGKGDMVSTWYYMPEPGIEKIAKYCNGDVVATAMVYRAMTEGVTTFTVETAE